MKVNRILTLLISSVIFFNGYSQTAKKYADQGYAKIELEDYQGAILAYSKAIAIDKRMLQAVARKCYLII